MPAPTLMVRSFGSYCTIRFSFAVLSCTLAEARGPAIRRFVFAPNNSILRFARAAPASASRSSSGVEG